MEARSVRFAGTTSVVPALRQPAELLHVLFADAQLHGFDAAAIRQGDADLPANLPPLRWQPRESPEAWPSASLICCCLLAFGLLDHTLFCRPSAALIFASLSPSEVRMTARFFALGRAFCFSIAGEHVLGRRDVS